jgi:hypothetical protein
MILIYIFITFNITRVSFNTAGILPFEGKREDSCL